MSYDYFYGQSSELFSYFRIPKALFQDLKPLTAAISMTLPWVMFPLANTG